MDKKELKQRLSEIYDLIQQDELDEAIAQLDSILEQNPDSADAWWMKANAESDPSVVRASLVKVLLIKPKDRRAREMLDMLNDAYPPNSPEDFKVMEQLLDKEAKETHDFPELGSDPFADIDKALGEKAKTSEEFDVFAEEDPFAALLGGTETATAEIQPEKKRRAKEKSGERGGGLLRRVALVLVVFLIVGAAVFVLAQQGGSDSDSDETTTDNATTTNGAVDLVLAPQTISPDSPMSQVMSQVDQRLQTAQYRYTATSYIAQNSTGQNTLFVDSCVCLTADAACQGNRIADLMRLAQEGMVIAEQVATNPTNRLEELTAFGVNITVCGGTDTVYRAYLPIDETAPPNRALQPSLWVVE